MRWMIAVFLVVVFVIWDFTQNQGAAVSAVMGAFVDMMHAVGLN
jgi:hypothetical protein